MTQIICRNNVCNVLSDRVIYARKVGEPVSAEVLEGEKIDLELASVSYAMLCML